MAGRRRGDSATGLPVQLTGRVALRDTDVAGTTVRRGEFVVIFLAAANRDPAVFPDPHRFDVQRPNAGRHLAFSGGRHFCLGAALARMEGEIGLRRFFTRFPDAQLAGEGSRRDTRVLRGGLACRCVWASRRPSRVSAGPRDPLTEPVAGHAPTAPDSPLAFSDGRDLEPGHEA